MKIEDMAKEDWAHAIKFVGCEITGCHHNSAGAIALESEPDEFIQLCAKHYSQYLDIRRKADEVPLFVAAGVNVS